MEIQEFTIDRALPRRVVAGILGRSPRTVTNLVASGRLRAVYGGTKRQRLTGVLESSLKQFLTTGKEGGHA